VFVADTVRLVEYFYITVPDKPGEGGRALNALKDAGINLLAFSGFPQGRRAQMDFIPADPAAFKQAAKKAKWKVVGPKRGFLVQGDDRVGAVADLLERLGAAKINVTAIDAVAVTDGRYGAIFWVAAKDVKKAATLLGASASGAVGT
jgi:hypothetical protein